MASAKLVAHLPLPQRAGAISWRASARAGSGLYVVPSLDLIVVRPGFHVEVFRWGVSTVGARERALSAPVTYSRKISRTSSSSSP